MYKLLQFTSLLSETTLLSPTAGVITFFLLLPYVSLIFFLFVFVDQVDINLGMDSGDLSDFVENVEWECHGMPAVKNVKLYGCCSDPYTEITYTLLLKRRSSFYIFNLLLPCFLISFLAPLGFYLPADSGEKVSLGVTVLLALTVFQLLVAESMPPAESMPYIGTLAIYFT